MSSKIYYFSGTGNSLAIARELKNNLDSDSSVVSIAILKNEKSVKIDTDILGFVFPVYYMNIPKIVKYFIAKLSFESNPYIFAVITCNSVPGETLFELNKCLAKKEQVLSAGFSIDMPGNALMTEPKEIEERLKNYKSKVEEISKYINKRSVRKFDGKDDLKTHIESNIIRVLGKNLYISPKNASVTEDCIGCGICEKVCPLNNIKIIDKRPTWGEECVSCLACFHWCPKNAIRGGRMLNKRDQYHHPEVSVINIANI